MIILLCVISMSFAQNKKQDTVNVDEIIITANRIPILLKNNPGAVSLVLPEALEIMPKTIGAEEALRLVPGVRIDNQHNGERVHVSIRGQGILTERGLRGIGVLLDGIPLNDPSGFVSDLYDIDWANLQKIEVLRGPSAGLYGSGGSAGILNITSLSGGSKPFGGIFTQSFGTNGFYKMRLGLNGTKDIADYGISFSNAGGNGYRDHQAFRSDKLYEKLTLHLSDKFSVTQILSHIDYFHQNPEGLNLSQSDNPKQANPDACPFNEYQKTNRTTFGFTGDYEINKANSLKSYAYYRTSDYKETSNKCAEYRNTDDAGAGLQYNFKLKTGQIHHVFGVGADYKYQNIDMYKLQSAADLNRVESIDDTNIETDSLLANQIISQSGIGVFALYRFELGRFNILANIRYDDISNELTNKMLSLDSAATDMDFTRTTFRLGASYNFSDFITFYADFSGGFIPPSTEELAANPLGYSGFNTNLVPATSVSFESGIRGNLGDNIFYDITGFRTDTENDFFRFKQSGRGNQEVFYGNAGNSTRYGIETYLTVNILKDLKFSAAYTFADYQYVSAEINPVYTDTAYVLTKPPADGQYLPNSPKHQLYAELVYRFKDFKISLGTEYQSEWAIYTDADAYNDKLDQTVYQNWQDGFNLYNAELSYNLKLKNLSAEFIFSARNFTGESYMAFTEPDPDGNSYQPGPKQEFFGTLKIRF